MTINPGADQKDRGRLGGKCIQVSVVSKIVAASSREVFSVSVKKIWISFESLVDLY